MSQPSPEKDELNALYQRMVEDNKPFAKFVRCVASAEEVPPWYVWVAVDAADQEIARSGQFRPNVNYNPMPKSVTAAQMSSGQGA